MFSRLILRYGIHQTVRQSIWRISYRRISSFSHQDELVAVPVGGNGVVNLQISRPAQAASHNDILIYLPPGLRPDERTQISSPALDIASFKKALPTTTIVDVQYRLAPRNIRVPGGNEDASEADDRFPTPIHDVFTAWDYITDSLELYNHDLVDGKKVYHRPRICIYGSHVGGALALSLALTNPNLITAVAVQDVLADWTGIDELAAMEIGGDKDGEGERKKRRDSRRQTQKERVRDAARELMRLRGKLFRTHSGYFDAFASPVLFLRAPGRDTPVEGLISGENLGGMKMRYGEEEDEVGVIKVDGQGYGPYDDDWHAREDDVGAHGREAGRLNAAERLSHTSRMIESVGQGANGDGPNTGSTLVIVSATSESAPSGLMHSDQDISHSSTRSADEQQKTPSAAEPPPRRRKVLRRWPPTAQPGDVLLPYINIFLTSPPSLASDSTDPEPQQTSVNISPVIRIQGLELQELLRRACFWGREKGVSEERVLLTDMSEHQDTILNVTADGTKDSRPMGEQEEVIKWLSTRFSDA